MSELVANKNQVPDFLKGVGKTSVGNIDKSDLIVPRVKLLQAISPEVTDFDTAKAGEFWHSIAGESMGKVLRAIPIIIRKSFVLWAPRNDDRGILARSPDGKHWQNWKDQDGNPKQFTVKPKGAAKDVTYTLAETVAESGLAEFGTSIPGNEQSPPAAALTYEMLFYFPDAPELSPAVIINTRSSVKKAKVLISKIEGRDVPHYAQIFQIGIKAEQGDEGPYYNYDYVGDGFVQEQELFERTKEMYEQWADLSWQANDATDDVAETSGGNGRPANVEPKVAEKDRKF